MCTAEVNVSHGVVSAVKRHEETPKHAATVKVQNTQKSFISDTGILCMSKAGDRVPITPEEKKQNAEILRLVNVVESNYSFNSCANGY